MVLLPIPINLIEIEKSIQKIQLLCFQFFFHIFSFLLDVVSFTLYACEERSKE
jgi:hypothetical protein